MLLEVQVIRFTDNIFEERLLLNLDKGQLPLLLWNAFNHTICRSYKTFIPFQTICKGYCSGYMKTSFISSLLG